MVRLLHKLVAGVFLAVIQQSQPYIINSRRQNGIESIIMLSTVYDIIMMCLVDVVLMHDGRIILNNSILSLESLGSLDDPVNAPLLCITTNPFCCETNRSGNWFPPQGAALLDNSSSSMGLYQSWEDDQSIQLNKPSDASLGQLEEGLYHCEVPDRDGIMQVVFAGLYSETRGGKFSH